MFFDTIKNAAKRCGQAGALASLLMALPIALGLACGGGGGGASGSVSQTSLPQASNTYFFIRYKQSVPDNPTLEGGDFGPQSDPGALLGSLGAGKGFYAGAQSNAAELPEFLVALKYSTPAFSALSGTYNAVVYGLYQSQVSAGQYSLRFSTTGNIATVSSIGTTNANSTGILSLLPQSEAFSLSASGRITWGGWTGAVSSSGDTMLLYRDRLFLLAALSGSHGIAEVEDRSFASLCLMQYEDDLGATTVASGTLTSKFSSARYEFNNLSLCQTSSQVTITPASRPFRLRPEDSSLIQITGAEDFSNTTEQGFLSNAGFHAIINPDNTKRPVLIIILP